MMPRSPETPNAAPIHTASRLRAFGPPLAAVLLLSTTAAAQSYPPRALLEEPGLEIHVLAIDHQGKEAREQESTLVVAGEKLRMEPRSAAERDSEGEEAGKSRAGEKAEPTGTATMFRGERDFFMVVNHDQRVFTVVDQEAIDFLAEEVRHAMRQMDEEIAALPPEQRRLMMIAMLSDDAPPPETRVVRTEDEAEKGGFDCVRYEVFEDEEKVREVWVADWDQLPRAADLRTTLVGLEGFFTRVTAAFEDVTSSLTGLPAMELGGSPFQDLKMMGGFPVLSRDFEDGRLVAETLVVSVAETIVPMASFSPPETYERRHIGE